MEQRKKGVNSPARAGAFYLATNFLTKALSLLLSPIFTRLLAPAEYGVYSLYITWSGIISVAVSLGITGGAVYRALGKFPKKENDAIAAALAIVSLIAAAIFSISVLNISRLPRLTGLPRAINLMMISEAFFNAAEALIFAHKRYSYSYREICVVNLIYATLSQGIAILLIYLTGLGGEARIYSSFAVTAALVLPRLAPYIKHWHKIDRELIKYLLKLSLPLLPNAIALTLIAQSDKIMIEHTLGISEVGKYSVAYSVGFMLTVVTGALYSAIQPWLMRKLNQKCEEDARGFTERLIRLSILGLLFFTLFIPELFAVIAAPEYREAEAAVYPLAVAGILQFISNILSANIIHTEKTGALSVFSVAALFSNLLLNYALIPSFGYLATAFTTAAAYGALLLSEQLFISRSKFPRLVGDGGLSPLFFIPLVFPIYLMHDFLASRLLLAAAIALFALPTAIGVVKRVRL